MRSEIEAYWGDSQGEHHRYRSWEHCYDYFHRLGPAAVRDDLDAASLQLGFYLASWGMYRGSSFLLQHAYTVHRSAVVAIADDRFAGLWEVDLGSDASHIELSSLVMELAAALKEAYRPFAPQVGSAQPTDTLLTKVLLGTVGCLPACDRYFINGFKRDGFKYSYLNSTFVKRVIGFCHEHLDELRLEQATIMQRSGQFYPLMKLVDMYFWQRGVDREAGITRDTPPT